MRGVKRENGVLKLVHPGRHIEIQRKPVTAAEVMSRNPRHCITRPDFFEFPWIVVKPESVLLPGSVFFIVPYHTVYNLLKARGHNRGHGREIKRAPPVSSCAHMNPKHQSCKQHNQGKSRKFFPHAETLCMCDWYKRYREESQDVLWPEVIDYRDREKRIEEQSQEESSFETRLYDARDYQTDSTDIDEEFPKSTSLEFVCNKNIYKLKSSVRKPESPRRVLNLRVSFDLPMQNEEL
ncbi:hypothetical protein L6164_003252 [Bauhinia variegata]|uniref:Uncharacterized protein n=1 Tax=Bauhinia variegata TaxID=167791 RepID=A0ACB9Q0R6_BAUVA|nr:hypothetical protein L6164_003252 [Bauhinia variegata]